MNIRFLAVAEQEFVEAADYYNEQRPGLGYEFAAEVKTTLGRIISFPNAWPAFTPRTRRCLTNRFPYAVLYQQRDGHILVIAIMHLKRDPKKWQERTTQV